MENASKALLIAGSVLIAILLIGTGMKIFNSTSGTTESAEHVMDATEVTMFNNQYYTYIGKDKSAGTVRSLANVILSNNAKANYKIVEILLKDSEAKELYTAKKENYEPLDSYYIRQFLNYISDSKTYKIEAKTHADGYVYKFEITEESQNNREE